VTLVGYAGLASTHRSIQHLIEVVTSLRECGVGFRSLTEGCDTTATGGKLQFPVLGALLTSSGS
jgi:DNA invertase Pin-like site-specific DNA recombinase